MGALLMLEPTWCLALAQHLGSSAPLELKVHLICSITILETNCKLSIKY